MVTAASPGVGTTVAVVSDPGPGDTVGRGPPWRWWGALGRELPSRAVRTDTVMFDVGGVVIVTPFEMAARLEHHRGWTAGTLGLFGPFDPDRDPDWRLLCAGELDEDGYWQRQAERLAPMLGIDGDDPTLRLIEILFAPEHGEIVRPEVRGCISALHAAGIRTAVLSNHLHRFHQPHLLERLLARFDPIIDLSYAQVRKPDPRAFEAALVRLGSPDPAAVIHVDDQPAHVAGAEKAGLRAVSFDPTDPAASFAAVLEAAGA